MRSYHPTFSCVAALFASAFAAADIPWKTAPTRPAEFALADLRLPDADRHIIVQFDQPVMPALRSELAAAGLRLQAYLHENAYFATLLSNYNPTAVVAALHGATLNAFETDPAQKLHPVFNKGETPNWAIVSPGSDPVIGAYVLLHPDVDLNAVGVPLLAGYGGVVRDRLDAINGLVFEASISVIHALAAEDAIQWIEPALPRMVELNNENRALTGANTVQAAPYSLDGTGVVVLVYDANTALTTHNDFAGRLTAWDNSGVATHATHVSGTIGGNGVSSGGMQRGMAPNCTLVSYGFQYDGTGIFLYTNPGDIAHDYADAISMHGAVIASNSIGTNTETNGFDCSIQGQYGVTDALIDSIVRGSASNGAPFRVVWAAGNERQGTRCNVEGFGSYYSSAPPAGAKNHLCIGATNANDDSMTSFSSWGPEDDGRMKPDFCAPGCQVGGDNGVTSCSNTSNTAYTVMCGTSMATPTVSGLSALLLQDYRAHFGGPDPRNSTLKVLFAQNAVDKGNVGPDHQFGYGSVRIQPTIDFMRSGNFTEDQVGQGETVHYHITVPPGTTQLKITLAWDDPPATPNVIPSLINDLDLRVFDPSSTQFFPWTLDPNNPSAPAVRTKANHIDNIEQVVVDNPVVGTWSVDINGTTVPTGPQPYSVASSIALSGGSFRMSLPNGAPTVMPPGIGASFAVTINPGSDTIVPGSAQLVYRYDSGTYLSKQLTSLGGNNYQADLPAPVCGATPEFYVRVTGASAGLVTNPTNAPTTVYTAGVYVDSIPYLDTMETDLGWTVGAPGDTATTGIWNRMDPQGTGAQPEDDHTANGTMCWVTDGNAGSSIGANDVDNGHTTLISPAIDATVTGDPILGYWRWYSNSAGAAPNTDIFTVDISNDNGATWTNWEVVGPSGAGTAGGWIFFERRIADVLPPTTQMKLRFIADDSGAASIIEAAIDDLQIRGRDCAGSLPDCNHNRILDSAETPPPNCCLGDANGDRQRDLSDLALVLSVYGKTSSDPGYVAGADFDGNGVIDLSDVAVMTANYGTPCP